MTRGFHNLENPIDELNPALEISQLPQTLQLESTILIYESPAHDL